MAWRSRPRRDSPSGTIHEGTVAFADQFEGYGNLVIVDHGSGAYSLYGYLGSVGAARGSDSTRRRGWERWDGTPAATLRCFELRVDGAAVDPLMAEEATLIGGRDIDT